MDPLCEHSRSLDAMRQAVAVSEQAHHSRCLMFGHNLYPQRVLTVDQLRNCNQAL